MYEVISIINITGSSFALYKLLSFLKKREYNQVFHNFILLFLVGLVFLIMKSAYMYFHPEIIWVMRLFGLTYWILALVFIQAMKKDYNTRCCDERYIKKKAGMDCDKNKQI